MKLTKSSLKEMIREVIKEEKQLNEDFQPFDIQSNPDVNKNPDDYASDKRKKGGGMKIFFQSYSSPEAKKVVEGRLKEYVQQLRKIEGKLVKDWMSAAKSGAIDFFDLMRGFNVGDVQRGHKYEIDFLSGLLERDKIQDRFRSYFKGRKGKIRR